MVYTSGHAMRVVDAIGPDVIKYELASENLQVTATDPFGWTSTVVEVGAGTTEFDVSDAAGILGRITTAANEDDGGQYQLLGSNFEFTSGQTLVYAGIELDLSDATQSDLLFGFAVTDTSVIAGVDDGVYIECLDGGATISTVTEKSGTETQTDSVGTMVNDTFHTLEMYFDGSSVYFFFDGAQTSTIHTANIPDDVVLRPTLAYLNGAGGVDTVDVRWAKWIQVGR